MNKKKYTLADWIYGVSFLLWFIGSIVVMILKGKQYPALVAIGIGQMLVVAGIMVIKKMIRTGSFEPLILWTLIIGLGCFSIGLMIQFGSESLKRKAMGYTLCLFFCAFFLFGALSIWRLVKLREKEIKCTMPVVATCMNVEESVWQLNGQTVIEYFLRYQFEYNGEVYKVRTLRNDSCDVKKGSSYNIYINPKNPRQFRETGPEDKNGIGAYIPGLIFFAVFVAIGICGMIYCGSRSEELVKVFMENGG